MVNPQEMNEAELTRHFKHYRISKEEYNLISKLLGRPPAGIEWALFSALWSEHCSYKSSKVHLKKFAKTLDSRVVNAEGENAGVVDLGFGERIVFKMESHNHPSFIEPYQGAATGVGGILRDIFTMGARPIALADYLCFGEPNAPRMASLIKGVVKGISGYGNCVGVPTISGQTEVDSSYNNNILVNAMAVGLLRPGEEVALSAAAGPGNYIVYVGAKTGKDGVHGAAMASESFDQDSEKKKPNVQIGDPYFEKLLIESCFEVLQKRLVVAIQDMGAAGLTSSSFEMSSKGRVGMRLDLSAVPLRDQTMTPEEILLSESQERMLLVCEPAKLTEIQNIFARWGLDAVCVGEVKSERRVELIWKGEVICSIDPDILVERAPQYQRVYNVWTENNKVERLPDSDLKVTSAVEKFFESPQGASRKSIYRQYDQRVGGMTARDASSSVSFQRLPDSGRGLAMTLGCRPYLMKVDARLGATDAVLYPALQMAIKGAKAIALTDCLNFASPEDPNTMSEFVASVDAITAVAQVLGTPVVSGNVSFYNETLGNKIASTPAIGAVGLRDNVENIPSDSFVGAGNPVFLVSSSLTGPNVLLSGFHDKKKGAFTGHLDLEAMKSYLDFVVDLGSCRCVLSSRAVGRGGLAVTLGKMTMNGLGFKAEVEKTNNEWLLDPYYQVIFEVDLAHQDEFLRKIKKHSQSVSKCPFAVEGLGTVQASGDLVLGHHGKVSVEALILSSQQGFLKILES